METRLRPLRAWLYACAALVFLMVIVGAITRLTESGLSITQWKPVTGALPPLNEAQWTAEFDLYKRSPEYRKEHFWMEIDDFKKIYFWEWFHRLLGRVIGLAYAMPLAFFWMRGMIPKGYGARLLSLLALGGAQGFMGWYMVQSGLVDIPSVSHYRLAAHLLLALLIYALLIWIALRLKGTHKAGCSDRPLFLHGLGVLAALTLTICWGAFTAGLDAGLIYNDSFPMMGGAWIPPEIFTTRLAFLDNPAGVQFMHRWLAIGAVCALLSLWGHAALKRKAPPVLHALAVAGILQAGLGIATLLSGVSIILAVVHQAGAVIVLTLLLACLHRFYTRRS